MHSETAQPFIKAYGHSYTEHDFSDINEKAQKHSQIFVLRNNPQLPQIQES